MIFKRAMAKLHAQDWAAIAIEFAIVVAGVFVGTQVSNWNDARIERAKTEQMARDLQPELRNLAQNFGTLIDYYAVTRRYADTAFAGWRGDPGVSDNDFVIAAYEASQNNYTGVSNDIWSQIFGADRLRDLKDQDLRENLSILMTTDLAAVERDLWTDYRRDVRKVIPEDVQDAIRAQCGDRRIALNYMTLPPSCDLKFPADSARAAAQALRQHPELVGEMRLHFAIVAAYVENITALRDIARRVLDRFGQA
jgi:hypothetical protein